MQKSDHSQLVQDTIRFVKKELHDAEGGHDWWHIERVWKNAKLIAEKETVDKTVVELAALLHDIADPKFHDGNEEIGPQKAQSFLLTTALDSTSIQHIINIIRHMSFKNSLEAKSFRSKEMDVVQDADRLDAIGAIGIARAFNYGGFKNRTIFDPEILPKMDMNKEEYKNSEAPTINHFYEKLLLLKDLMNTKTGKEIALQRHQFMKRYLDQFYSELGISDWPTTPSASIK